MKLGDLVVCQPPQEKCSTCPHVGKHAKVMGIRLDGLNKRFKLMMKNGSKFNAPEECLIPLKEFKVEALRVVGDKLLKEIKAIIDHSVARGDTESLQKLNQVITMFSCNYILKELWKQGFRKEMEDILVKAGMATLTKTGDSAICKP